MLASRQFVNCWHEGAAAPQGCQSPWQAGRTVPAHRAVLLCSGVTAPVPSRGDLHAVHTAYVSTSLRSTAVLPMGKGNLPCSFTQTASAPGSGWHKQERGSPFLTFFPVLLHSDETPGLLQAGQARPGSLSLSSQEGFPVPLALRRPCVAFSRAHPYLRGSESPDPAAQLAAVHLSSPPPRKAPRPHLPPLLDASAPPAAAAALPPASPPPSSRMRTTSLAPLAPATPLPSPRGSETALTGRSAQAQKAGPRRRSVSLSPRPPRRMRGPAAPAFLARAPSPRPRAGA